MLYLVYKSAINVRTLDVVESLHRFSSWRKFYHVLVMQYYDVRKECVGNLCYDFSNMEKFLNQNSVRNALGVGNMDFVSCSSKVYSAMLMDWMRNLEVGIPALIDDGIKVLVYAGEYDLICNWLGKFSMLVVQNPPFEVPLFSEMFLKNFFLLLFWNLKGIRGGFMKWIGLVRKNLQHPKLFRS